MIRYVVGFLFNTERNHVALIQKNRPAWQANHYNGIGGHVETEETYEQAMQREFEEETGVLVDSWEICVIMTGENYTIYCFRAFSEAVWATTSMTDEAVSVHAVNSISTLNTISNLRWLVPLLADTHVCFPVSIQNT